MELVRRLNSPEFEEAKLGFLGDMVALAGASDTGPVSQAYCEASTQAYHEVPGYAAAIDHYLSIEKASNTHYQINKLHKALQEIVFRDTEGGIESYPERARDKVWWLGFIASKFKHPDSPKSQSLRSNLQRPLQINRGYERSKIPALGLAFPKTPRLPREAVYVHEYGAAAGLTLKAAATRTIAPTTVLNPDGSVNELNTAEFNALTVMPPRFTEGIGIEMQPPENESDERWIKACTMDLDDPEFTRHERIFDFLMRANPSQQPVKIIKGNFLELDHASKAELGLKKAAVANASHVVPQNEESLEEMLSVMAENSKPDARIFVTEYATVDPGNKHNLILLDRWYKKPFSNVTFMYVPEEGFVPIVRWETGHCKTAILCEGIGRLTPVFET